MTYRSKFKHGFTNRGCLHCTNLKALHNCHEKTAQVKGYVIFPSKFPKWDFQDFQNI